MRKFIPGSRVTFRDPNGNVLHGHDSLSTGVVSGEPWDIKGRQLVPVWCQRDQGREPTTILVDESNIVSVEFPES